VTKPAEGIRFLIEVLAAPAAIGQLDNVHAGLFVGVGNLRVGGIGGFGRAVVLGGL
jgi:hypothetical protein